MLRDLQLEMMKVVSARHHDHDGPPAAIEALVNGDERMDAAGRLHVYAGMYGARLRAALASTYPALLAALGEDAFSELSADYVDAHPSHHPSLRGLGRKLPEFLGEGWQAGLAALEWARHDVFDAAEEELLTMEAVAALGPEGIGELPVRLIGAHRLVPVAHEVEATWRAATSGGEVAPPGEAPGVLLVWREGTSVFHRRPGDVELEALGAAATGLSFAALCERLIESCPVEEAPRIAGELLGRWLGDKLLAR